MTVGNCFWPVYANDKLTDSREFFDVSGLPRNFRPLNLDKISISSKLSVRDKVHIGLMKRHFVC